MNNQNNTIPEGWKREKLEKICLFKGGSAFKEEYQGDSYENEESDVFFDPDIAAILATERTSPFLISFFLIRSTVSFFRIILPDAIASL